MMPGMDGFGLAERIRDDPSLVSPLMIMLTSSGESGESERARRLGISAYLTKPVRQSELFDTLMNRILAQSPVPIRSSPTRGGSTPVEVQPRSFGRLPGAGRSGYSWPRITS